MQWVGPQEMSLEAQLFLLPEPEPSFHQDHSLAMLQRGLYVGRVFQVPVLLPFTLGTT